MFAIEDIIVFMLILTRIVGMFLFVPFFSHNSIPMMARAALASGITLMVFPLIELDGPVPNHVLMLVLMVGKELAVGLALGFAVRMFFFIIDFASHILTVEIGLMAGAEFDPTSLRGSNPLGSIMYFLALMILLLSGAEYNIIEAFVVSYEVSPLGLGTPDFYSGDYIVQASANVFRLGLVMAAPVIAVNFLVNLVFAVLGKVVPKLNVFILSFPARILAGTGILAFSATLIVHYAIVYSEKTPEIMLRFILFKPLF